jgi:hypothetical protein
MLGPMSDASQSKSAPLRIGRAFGKCRSSSAKRQRRSRGRSGIGRDRNVTGDAVNPEAREPRLNPASAAVVDGFIQGFLSGDRIIVRLADLPLALVRWAYLEGLRYGGGTRLGEGGCR